MVSEWYDDISYFSIKEGMIIENYGEPCLVLSAPDKEKNISYMDL